MKVKINKEKLIEYGFERTSVGYYNSKKMFGINESDLNVEIEVIKIEDNEEIKDIFSVEDLDLFDEKEEIAYSSKWVDIISN